MGSNHWDANNKVLYDLCRKQPQHTDLQVVLAKINIVGRVYAAAMERRKIIMPNETNETFHAFRVAPAIMRSELDEWIDEASSVSPNGPLALPTMLRIHERTMNLFSRISGLNKRSLASAASHSTPWAD
jgi:hypothetical protein